MTKEEKLIPPVQKAAARVVGGMSADGGWFYNYASQNIDMSVTGWQVQALRAAQLTGLKIDGLDGALTEAAKGVKKMAGKNGHFIYHLGEGKGGNGKPSLTGAGVLSLIYLKEGGSEEVRNGFKALLEADEKDKYEQAQLYAWYYNTQACYQKGDPVWNKWRRTFQKELLAHQLPTGAWEAEGTGGAASSSAARSTTVISQPGSNGALTDLSHVCAAPIRSTLRQSRIDTTGVDFYCPAPADEFDRTARRFRGASP
jgi:hypothetical protein